MPIGSKRSRGSGLARKVPSGNKGSRTGGVFRGNGGGKTNSIPFGKKLPGNPTSGMKRKRRSY